MRRLTMFLALSGLLAMFANAQQSIDEEALNIPAEIVSLRTERSETIDNRDGTRTSKVYSGRKYYHDGETLIQPDLSTKTEAVEGFTHVVNAGIYTCRFDAEDTGKGHAFSKGNYSVTYTPIGNWDGKTITLTPTVNGIKEEVEFAYGAEMSVQWIVVTNAVISFEHGSLVFADDSGKFLFRIPRATAWDATLAEIPVAVSFTGDTLSYTLEISANTVWPVVLDPTTTTQAGNDGFVRTEGTDYASVRNGGSSPIMYTSLLAVGQRFTSPDYRVYHMFASFPIPQLVSSSACTLYVYGQTDNSVDDFDIYIHGASGYKSTLTTSDFSLFDGREVNEPHTGTILNESWNSSSYVQLGWNSIVFNAAGIDSLEAAGGDTLWIALLSKEDYDNSAPTAYEYVVFNSSEIANFEPYLSFTYVPGPDAPTDFAMTALDTVTIACSWTDQSDNEEKFYIINQADSTVIDSTAANAVADTIGALSPNTEYTWIAVADSAGLRGYSDPDDCYTLLSAPKLTDITIMPISSDTLRISVTHPSNSSADSTGMEVYAVSGVGADGSGWLTGEYSYLDSGVNPDSVHVYKVRFRNGDGIATAWSPEISYSMSGLDTLTIYLSGDSYDDYNIDFGGGRTDSTVVRAGASDSGVKFDGFLSFELPWYVHKGGVDSLFLSITRTVEESLRTPEIHIYGIPVKDIDPVETLDAGAQDSTDVSISWTIVSGEGLKSSPNLRSVFREWQDLSPNENETYGFGLRLDDNAQADSVRAVFLDASHPSYSDGTSLTIYYTKGRGDSLEAAPTDFSISVSGPDSLVASWTDNSYSELGFVLLNLADSTLVAGTDTLAENTTNVGVGGLSPDTVYEWFVVAFTASDELSSDYASARTLARTPGVTVVSAVSASALKFIIDPLDNPSITVFAVQDSITGLYVDGLSEPDTLRTGPPGVWGWRTYAEWGAALGDTLAGLAPDSLYVLRAKAKSGE